MLLGFMTIIKSVGSIALEGPQGLRRQAEVWKRNAKKQLPARVRHEAGRAHEGSYLDLGLEFIGFSASVCGRTRWRRHAQKGLERCASEAWSSGLMHERFAKVGAEMQSLVSLSRRDPELRTQNSEAETPYHVVSKILEEGVHAPSYEAAQARPQGPMNLRRAEVMENTERSPGSLAPTAELPKGYLIWGSLL